MIYIFVFLASLAVIPGTLAVQPDDDFEQITLPLGDSSIQIDFFPEKTGIPQGGIIITEAEPSSYLANHLARVLSHHGWSVTITNLTNEFSLPARTRHTGQTRFAEPDLAETDNQDKSPESLVETTEINPQTPSASNTPGGKLDAVIEFMESEKGQLNLVLLSLNRSWIHLEQYISDKSWNLSNVHALILLDVDQKIEMNKLPKVLSILDIDTNLLRSSAFDSRRIGSRHFRIKHYQQLHLPARYVPHRNGEGRLSKRIRGWLSFYVRGMEIGKYGV